MADAFDLFVVHAPADAEFVRGYLLPALNVPSRVVTASSDNTARVWTLAMDMVEDWQAFVHSAIAGMYREQGG